MTSPAIAVLIDRCETLDIADKAWGQMMSWAVAFSPSQVMTQVNRALDIVHGVNPGCRNDPLRPRPHRPGDIPPIGPDGLCQQCRQPQDHLCRCTQLNGKHARKCPAKP